MTHATKVAGVVVTFHPDEGFVQRVSSMAREVGALVIVDNSADATVAAALASLAPRIDSRLVIAPRNLGIAAALNGAFTELAREGYAWVVAFDQDSTPERGCVSALLRVAESRSDASVIGCNWIDEARPEVASRHLRRGAAWQPWFRRDEAQCDLAEVAFVITSGSLFRIATWEEIGGFRDDLFLDLVDTEYCLRAGRSGGRIMVAADAHLRHRRGAKRPTRWCGRTWWPACMPPVRVHLLARNRVWALAHYGGTRWPWALFELTHTAFLLLCILFLEDATGPKLGAFFRGVLDGLCGRLGPPPGAGIKPTSTCGGQTTPS